LKHCCTWCMRMLLTPCCASTQTPVTRPRRSSAGSACVCSALGGGRHHDRSMRTIGQCARDPGDFSTAPGDNPAVSRPNCCPARPLSSVPLAAAAEGARDLPWRGGAQGGGRKGGTDLPSTRAGVCPSGHLPLPQGMGPLRHLRRTARATVTRGAPCVALSGAE
jgi:hypothetical protein